MFYEHISKMQEILGVYCKDFLHLDGIPVSYSDHEEKGLMDIFTSRSSRCQIYNTRKKCVNSKTGLDDMRSHLKGMNQQRDNA